MYPYIPLMAEISSGTVLGETANSLHTTNLTVTFSQISFHPVCIYGVVSYNIYLFALISLLIKWVLFVVRVLLCSINDAGLNNSALDYSEASAFVLSLHKS